MVAIGFLLVALVLLAFGTRLLVDGVALSLGLTPTLTALPAECDEGGCLLTIDRGEGREVTYVEGLPEGQRGPVELARTPIRGTFHPTRELLDGGYGPMFSGLLLLLLGGAVGAAGAITALERPDTKPLWGPVGPGVAVLLVGGVAAAALGLYARTPIPSGSDLIPKPCVPELVADELRILCSAAWTGLESDVSFILVGFTEPSTAYVRVPPRDLLPRLRCSELPVSTAARTALADCLSASQVVLLDGEGREHLVAIAALPSTVDAREAFEALAVPRGTVTDRAGGAARPGIEVTLSRPGRAHLEVALEVLGRDRAALPARTRAEPFGLPALPPPGAKPSGVQTQVAFEGHYLVIDQVISPAGSTPLPRLDSEEFRSPYEPLLVEDLLRFVHP